MQGLALDRWTNWTIAWNIFLAVLTEARGDPNLPSRMAKHFEIVSMLASKNQEWRQYDTKFRQLLELGLVGWGDVHSELLSIAQTRMAPQVQVSAGRSSGSSNSLPIREYPKGFCFRHNRGLSCSDGPNCRFVHRCFNCSGTHAFIACRQQVIKPFRFSADSLRAHHGQQMQTKQGPNQPSERNSFPRKK